MRCPAVLVTGATVPPLLIIRVLPVVGSRDAAVPTKDGVGFGRVELPPPDVAPPYPNLEGCLSPVDEAAGAVGSLLGAQVTVFAVALEPTIEVGLPSFDFAVPVAALSADTFSLDLVIFDGNPNVDFGGPATVAAFEGRGRFTPCRVGLCAGFDCARIVGSGGRGAEIEGRGRATTVATEVLVPVPMADVRRSGG